MPIFVLNHLPESSIKSSTLSLQSTHCHYTDWNIKYRTIYMCVCVCVGCVSGYVCIEEVCEYAMSY